MASVMVIQGRQVGAGDLDLISSCAGKDRIE
jgi:hypothetical protein